MEVWSSNARLYASASILDVLKKEDQRVLLNSILDRDLFLSLQLVDDDNFMAGIEKVKIVFTGLCNIFMRRVKFLKEAARGDQLGSMQEVGLPRQTSQHQRGLRQRFTDDALHSMLR